jgi:hypothetical protein
VIVSIEPDALARQVEASGQSRTLPPLDQWQPELSGDMDLVIRRDGSWVYQSDPITRDSVIRLFSTILRREPDGEFYLVTPAEKWRIRVEDTPLLAHSLEVEGDGDDQVLRLTTNVGEILTVGEAHPLTVGEYPETGEPRPVIGVRHGVEARLVTAAFYALAERVVEREVNGATVYGVMSQGKFWPVGPGS